MLVEDEKVNDNIVKDNNKNKVSFKKYVALKTIKITANGVFNLVEGQEIPKEISGPFVESLVLSNLIKLIK